MSDISAPSAPAAPSSSSSATPSTPSSSPSSGSSKSTGGLKSTPTQLTSAQALEQIRNPVAEDVLVPSDLSGEEPAFEEGAEASEVEPEVAETPWYEAYQEGVHGVPVQELLQAISEGRIPEQLWDQLVFDMKDGDREWKGTINDMRNGAMLRENHTRKSQELAAEKKQFYAERDEVVEYFKNWQQDPQQLLFGLHRMGMPVLKMTELLTTQLTKAEAMNQVNPGSGDEWLQAVFQKAEMEDMKRRLDRQNQHNEQAEHAKREETLRNNIRQASTEIFKEIGLELEESSWELYKQHTQLLYDQKQPGPNGRKSLSRADLKKAAQATKSQLEQYARAYMNRQPAPKPGAKLGTGKLDAGAPKKVPARAPQPGGRRMTTAEALAGLSGGFRQR